MSRRIFLRISAALMAVAGGALITRGIAAQKVPDRGAIFRTVFASGAARPRLSRAHRALMRELQVMWMPVENGAPAIDAFRPLVRGGAVVEQVMSILDTTDHALAIRILAETALLVPMFMQRASLRPGTYPVPPARRDFFANPGSGVDKFGQFRVSAEHMLLLRAAVWREVDAGNIDDVLESGPNAWPMPYIEPKRPYGDSSYYQIDMASLLGRPYRLDSQGYAIPDPVKDRQLKQLHEETLAALQVLLVHGAVPGIG